MINFSVDGVSNGNYAVIRVLVNKTRDDVGDNTNIGERVGSVGAISGITSAK